MSVAARCAQSTVETLPVNELRNLLRNEHAYSGIYTVAAKHLPGYGARERAGAIALLRTERDLRENRRAPRQTDPPVWLVLERDAWRRSQSVHRETIVKLAARASAVITEPEEGDVARLVIGPVPRSSTAAGLLRTYLARAGIRVEETFEGAT